MSHIGVNLGFGNLHEELTDEQMYAGELGLAELADRLGYDSLWAVEHHFDDYAMCPDNVVLLANVAGRAKRLKLGTAAVILPWNDPLRVAEKIIMLDILSEGRALFGMGRGLSRMEYAPFGVDMSESRARFDEAAAMIVAAVETGWIEGDGPYYPRPRTQLRPGPPRSFRPAVLRRRVAGLGHLVRRPRRRAADDRHAAGAEPHAGVHQLPRAVARGARR